ncbi:MAG: nicotinate (nicotinamide) nucleotide adenylyltransferase [Bacteroidales bacterium]|jgi:nicotinate-nucleotide adenylyltransferase|nr:nicotinate (nicotinamide) nucleotide adenylyltransferase [Bacteroidales bacterium]
MKVAVYSGSFNPLHIGHLAILKYLTGEGGFDYVYLIVSPKNPLKEGISASSGQDRYNAAIAAVNRHFPAGKVKVDDIELTMPEPHYTIRTLDALREREPENEFTLVMGADNLADIRRWRDYCRILKEYGVAVYPRQGFDLERVRQDLLDEDHSYNITIMNAEMVDISSTIIRNAIAEGQDVSGWLM